MGAVGDVEVADDEDEDHGAVMVAEMNTSSSSLIAPPNPPSFLLSLFGNSLHPSGQAPVRVCSHFIQQREIPTRVN